MIGGTVNARHEAIVRLRVRGPSGIESELDVIVDSGFSSSVTLPVAMVETLELDRESSGVALLADGSIRNYDMFAAEIEWGGKWRAVLVSAIGNEPLLGMSLIAGHKLVIDVVPGGLVEILLLP